MGVNEPKIQSLLGANVERLFDRFCEANTMQAIFETFDALCRALCLNASDSESYRTFYIDLRFHLWPYWKAQQLFLKLDKRAIQKEYFCRKQRACSGSRALVIGAGPCGLRAAIELALLGCRVTVLEKRDRFSRNNVLHLWPFLINDLKSLGAKKFFGKFCAGSIEHISIRTLQCILLKVCLLFGVEVLPGVSFEEVIEPQNEAAWRVRITPSDHPIHLVDWHVIVGADGRRNSLPGFRRRQLRCKLAIAITANFKNFHTAAEARVEEISGVAFIFNQAFFTQLRDTTGIELENIVYYKDETHYFVMTATKRSLLNKGVIIQDYEDASELLRNENICQEALMAYAREAANAATVGQLPQPLQFAVNHYNQPDVAMFDFTSMYASESACRVSVRQSHQLLMCLVGDSLLEPFWPTGSGCARGFLGVMDAAWTVRNWLCLGQKPLHLLAEREAVYQRLSQATPVNMHQNYDSYTIDPSSRYPALDFDCLKIHQVRHLLDTDEVNYSEEEPPSPPNHRVAGHSRHGQRHNVSATTKCASGSGRRFRRESGGDQQWLNHERLLRWFQIKLDRYERRDLIHISDLSSSWLDGQAFLYLLHLYRPKLIDIQSIGSMSVTERLQRALQAFFDEFNVQPLFSIDELARHGNNASSAIVDKLAQLCYMEKLYCALRTQHATRDPDAEAFRPARHQSTLFRRRLHLNRQAAAAATASKTSSKAMMEAGYRVSREGVINPGLAQTRRQELIEALTFGDKEMQANMNANGLTAAGSSVTSAAAAAAKKNALMHERQLQLKYNMLHGGSRNMTLEILGGKLPGGTYEGLTQSRMEQFTNAMDATTAVTTVGTSPCLLAERPVPTGLADERRQELLLSPPTTLPTTPIAPPTQNKVKDLQEKLFPTKPWRKQGVADLAVAREAAEPAKIRPSNQVAELFNVRSKNDSCYFCGQRVYLAERHSVEGYCFHMSCFKCQQCGTKIRMGLYQILRMPGKAIFLCTLHYMEVMEAERAEQIRTQISELLCRKNEDRRPCAARDSRMSSPWSGVSNNKNGSSCDSQASLQQQQQQQLSTTSKLSSLTATDATIEPLERIEFELVDSAAAATATAATNECDEEDMLKSNLSSLLDVDSDDSSLSSSSNDGSDEMDAEDSGGVGFFSDVEGAAPEDRWAEALRLIQQCRAARQEALDSSDSDSDEEDSSSTSSSDEDAAQQEAASHLSASSGIGVADDKRDHGSSESDEAAMSLRSAHHLQLFEKIKKERNLLASKPDVVTTQSHFRFLAPPLLSQPEPEPTVSLLEPPAALEPPPPPFSLEELRQRRMEVFGPLWQLSMRNPSSNTLERAKKAFFTEPTQGVSINAKSFFANQNRDKARVVELNHLIENVVLLPDVEIGRAKLLSSTPCDQEQLLLADCPPFDVDDRQLTEDVQDSVVEDNATVSQNVLLTRSQSQAPVSFEYELKVETQTSQAFYFPGMDDIKDIDSQSIATEASSYEDESDGDENHYLAKCDLNFMSLNLPLIIEPEKSVDTEIHRRRVAPLVPFETLARDAQLILSGNGADVDFRDTLERKSSRRTHTVSESKHSDIDLLDYNDEEEAPRAHIDDMEGSFSVECGAPLMTSSCFMREVLVTSPIIVNPASCTVSPCLEEVNDAADEKCLHLIDDNQFTTVSSDGNVPRRCRSLENLDDVSTASDSDDSTSQSVLRYSSQLLFSNFDAKELEVVAVNRMNGALSLASQEKLDLSLTEDCVVFPIPISVALGSTSISCNQQDVLASVNVCAMQSLLTQEQEESASPLSQLQQQPLRAVFDSEWDLECSRDSLLNRDKLFEEDFGADSDDAKTPVAEQPPFGFPTHSAKENDGFEAHLMCLEEDRERTPRPQRHLINNPSSFTLEEKHQLSAPLGGYCDKTIPSAASAASRTGRSSKKSAVVTGTAGVISKLKLRRGKSAERNSDCKLHDQSDEEVHLRVESKCKDKEKKKRKSLLNFLGLSKKEKASNKEKSLPVVSTLSSQLPMENAVDSSALESMTRSTSPVRLRNESTFISKTVTSACRSHQILSDDDNYQDRDNENDNKNRRPASLSAPPAFLEDFHKPEFSIHQRRNYLRESIRNIAERVHLNAPDADEDLESVLNFSIDNVDTTEDAIFTENSVSTTVALTSAAALSSLPAEASELATALMFCEQESKHYNPEDCNNSSRSSALRRNRVVSHDSSSVEEARVRRRAERLARREARRRELERLREAQNLQQQMDEVEERMSILESRGVAVEKRIQLLHESGNTCADLLESQNCETEESSLTAELFRIVYEKNDLMRLENELNMRARDLELSDRQESLQATYRALLAEPEYSKNVARRSEERRVLKDLLDVIQERDTLVDCMENERVRVEAEERRIQEVSQAKGIFLSPLTAASQIRLGATKESVLL